MPSGWEICPKHLAHLDLLHGYIADPPESNFTQEKVYLLIPSLISLLLFCFTLSFISKGAKKVILIENLQMFYGNITKYLYFEEERVRVNALRFKVISIYLLHLLPLFICIKISVFFFFLILC